MSKKKAGFSGWSPIMATDPVFALSAATLTCSTPMSAVH